MPIIRYMMIHGWDIPSLILADDRLRGCRLDQHRDFGA